MTLLDFKSSLDQEQPDESWSPIIRALWYNSKGDWDKAHDIVDPLGGSEGNWIHAHLHRVEGDLWNADYWYRRANRQRLDVSIEEEWDIILRAILE